MKKVVSTNISFAFVNIKPTMALAKKRSTNQEVKPPRTLIPHYNEDNYPVLFPIPDKTTDPGLKQLSSLKF